jgi:hypothetical protein
MGTYMNQSYKRSMLFIWGISFSTSICFAKEITSIKSVQDLQDIVRATILHQQGYSLTPSESLYAQITVTLDTFKNDAWVKRRKKDIETFMRENPAPKTGPSAPGAGPAAGSSAPKQAKEITSVKSVQDLQNVVRATILQQPGYSFTPSQKLYDQINTALESFSDDAWVKRRKHDIEKFMLEHPIARTTPQGNQQHQNQHPKIYSKQCVLAMRTQLRNF